MMDKLILYKNLVTQYHQALDLVSDLALDHFDRKLSDSLAYVTIIRENHPDTATIIDVGSGAGLPGIVLGIALPHHQIILVERRQKRATFLKIVASKLELGNIQVFCGDVTLLKSHRADVISAMAVGSFKLLYCLTRQVHQPKLLLVSKKGPDFAIELEALSKALGITFDSVQAMSLNPHPISPADIVSRETIYGNLVAVRLMGGKECNKV